MLTYICRKVKEKGPERSYYGMDRERDTGRSDGPSGSQAASRAFRRRKIQEIASAWTYSAGLTAGSTEPHAHKK